MGYILGLFGLVAAAVYGYQYGCTTAGWWCEELHAGTPLTAAIVDAGGTAEEIAEVTGESLEKVADEALATVAGDGAGDVSDASSDDAKGDDSTSVPEEKSDEEDESKEGDKKDEEDKKDSSDQKAVKNCSEYLTADIRPDGDNDKQEVIKLEKFLNEFEGEKLIAGGVYDGIDQAAVKRFQEKYKEDVLEPFGLSSANGKVLSGTRKKINEIYCEKQ